MYLNLIQKYAILTFQKNLTKSMVFNAVSPGRAGLVWAVSRFSTLIQYTERYARNYYYYYY